MTIKLMTAYLLVQYLCCWIASEAFVPSHNQHKFYGTQKIQTVRHICKMPTSLIKLNMVPETKTEEEYNSVEGEEVTKKYGLEAGLFQVLKSDKKDKGSEAKELLKRYGSAYLLTSISLSLISISICYVLVDNGIDMAAVLGKIGIDATSNSEKAGTFAIAYAAHKAASPIRFPPTVALTPLVARFLGKKIDTEENSES